MCLKPVSVSVKTAPSRVHRVSRILELEMKTTFKSPILTIRVSDPHPFDKDPHSDPRFEINTALGFDFFQNK